MLKDADVSNEFVFFAFKHVCHSISFALFRIRYRKPILKYRTRLNFNQNNTFELEKRKQKIEIIQMSSQLRRPPESDRDVVRLIHLEPYAFELRY